MANVRLMPEANAERKKKIKNALSCNLGLSDLPLVALGLFRGREKSSERDVTGLPRSGEAATGCGRQPPQFRGARGCGWVRSAPRRDVPGLKGKQKQSRVGKISGPSRCDKPRRR